MRLLIILISLVISIPSNIYSQIEIHSIGLKNQSITSLKIWYGIIAVGTDQNGVYWSQFESPDSIDWKHIELPDKNIRTVYPHKSGPLGWAIGAGIRPAEGDTNFVYCSFMGEKPKSISNGIDKSRTFEISKLDGFPDPTICGETFAAGGGILYRRFFADTVWHPVYNLTIEGNFSTVSVRQNYPTILAGGGEGFANHLLIKSLDYGNTWQDISPLIYVQSVDFTDDSAKVIFATDNMRIRKSIDYGTTWIDVFNNEENLFINKLRYYPYMNFIFVVGSASWNTGPAFIYYNDISTEEWNKLYISINDPIVDIDYGPDNWIYIATKDSGVFRFKNFVVSIENNISVIPKEPTLYQNYPNPFNPTTTIEYFIPDLFVINDLQVQLKVYDSLGKKILTLLNKRQKSGKYKVKFDANNLVSGIYYYSLTAGDFTKSKKMIVLK